MVRDANSMQKVCNLLELSWLKAILEHKANRNDTVAVCITILTQCVLFTHKVTSEQTLELQDRYAGAIIEVTKQFLEEIK